MESSLLLALLLLFAGILVCALFFWCFWRGVAEAIPSINIRPFLQRKRLQRLESDLSKIDEAIQKRDIRSLEKLLINSYLLEEHAPFSWQVITKHNMAVFSRAVTALDAFDAHFRALGTLEESVHEHSTLLKLFLDAVSARQKVAKVNASKESKHWATKELDAKMNNLRDQLHRNSETLLREMKALVQSLQTQGSEVKYH